MCADGAGIMNPNLGGKEDQSGLKAALNLFFRLYFVCFCCLGGGFVCQSDDRMDGWWIQWAGGYEPPPTGRDTPSPCTLSYLGCKQDLLINSGSQTFTLVI